MDCSHAGLLQHAKDGSPFSIQPQAVLYPKTTSDIKHAIAFAREYHIPLTVCGGLTAGSGGGLGEGIVLDMTRYFTHVRQVNMLEHTITVDAGVTIDDLRDKLASWDMEIPLLEREYGNATVGGFVATKTATASTFYAGTIREWIEGLTVVVDTGEEHHLRDGITPSGRLLGIYQSVFPIITEESPTLRAARREQSDDATGYCIWNTSIGPRQLIDQIVGSEGTLGVITSVTFRVTERKSHSQTIITPVPSITLLETYASIAKHHSAERLFMFDASYRKLLDTFHTGMIDASLPVAPFYLLATCKHNDLHTLETNMRTFQKALPGQALIINVEEPVASKLISHDFLHSLFASYTKGTHMIATVGEGIIVSPHVYTETLSAVDETLGTLGHLYTLTSYIGSGHIAVTTSFDAQSLSYETNLADYRDKLIEAIKRFKPGISAVSGDGLERTTLLPYVFNDATRTIFKHIKEAWDPLSIFNPSKKLSVTKEYLREHTTRSL